MEYLSIVKPFLNDSKFTCEFHAATIKNNFHMKKLLFITVLFFLISKLFGQDQGISYQAVIIDQGAQEIAGVDISGNIIPNHEIMVRFTILDVAGTIDYQEEQSTSTDAYGMVNLIIGQGSKTSSSTKAFQDIDWNGTSKELKVDISLSQTSVFYTDFSLQQLTFVPYAYHKNITATGTLNVANKSTLKDLSVDATTNLNGSLDINNGSPTHLSGILSVEQNTTLADTLTVNSASNLNGQVVITADLTGNDDALSSYPLCVKGSNQGIAIKVNGSRNNSKNFVTFWDDVDALGRIEGESVSEVFTDPEYLRQNASLLIEAGIAGAHLYAAMTATTPCVGLGGCVTVPTTSFIVFAFAKVVIKGAQIGVYNAYRLDHAGVAYKSKGADYAEYLPKSNPAEKFFPGDLVGVTGGNVSLSTQNARKIMVVSGKPIVLGNLPKEGMESSYQKIAFMGQVEVKVVGKVNIGDYIIPRGNNDGTGIGVMPDSLKPEDYEKIAGVAWSASQTESYGYVNVAVGINTNDFARLYMKQNEEIKSLKEQINRMNLVLTQLVPNYAKLSGVNVTDQNNSSSDVSSTSSDVSANAIKSAISSVVDAASIDSLRGKTIIYYDLNKGLVEEGIKKAKEILQKQGILDQYTLFKMLDSDTQFRETFVDEMYSAVKSKMDEYAKRDIKSGANVIKNY